jgi:hypothetical protein
MKIYRKKDKIRGGNINVSTILALPVETFLFFGAVTPKTSYGA